MTDYLIIFAVAGALYGLARLYWAAIDVLVELGNQYEQQARAKRVRGLK
jgi:hypothetical protein